MTEESKIGRYTFLAEPFHCDSSGKLTMGYMGNTLLNCADFHSKSRGFGMTYLHEHNCTWVLSRFAIEMYEMPAQYEQFEVETWVENVYRLFTDRNFAIHNAAGTIIGYGRSVWAMIDVTTRKPLDLLALHSGSITDYICDHPCPMDKPSRIKLRDGKEAGHYVACYSDIDINGHVNSIKYIDHILDLFPLAYHVSRKVTRFEMAYIAEAYCGETLTFYMEETAPHTFEVEVKKEETLICRSKVCFSDEQTTNNEVYTNL